MAEVVILDGKMVAAELRGEVAARVEALMATTPGANPPELATILVGDDPASDTYVRMKGRACESVGMTSQRIALPDTTTTTELIAVIDRLNADPAVRGILLQHPVPEQVDERLCFDRIAPEKDVDGVTTFGFGAISFGLKEAYGSCTPAGIIRLLDAYNIEIAGKHAVVVGRSAILGKPMAMMLLERNATVTICHSRTRDLPGIIGRADIVVAAVGRPEFIKGDWIADGACVVDAGYNPGNIGDVEYEACKAKASSITPVPGGVGPMTIATLLYQTLVSAERFAAASR